MLGVIDLTSRMSTVHPHSFAVAVATAGAVEAHLRCLMHEHDARLRSRYRDRVLSGGDDRALVTASGRVIATDPAGWMPRGARSRCPPTAARSRCPSGVPRVRGAARPRRAPSSCAGSSTRAAGRAGGAAQLRLLGDERPRVIVDGRSVALGRRQAEILALLCLRPDGLTDRAARRGGLRRRRQQQHRARRGLAAAQARRARDRDRARTGSAATCESDLGRVRTLLLRGAVQEAAELYAGPLLPHSDAPGVERERDALEGWMRHAVMTGDDRDALWAWLQTPSGEDDPAGWKQLLSALDFRDPRRSRAAAQVGRLRNGTR